MPPSFPIDELSSLSAEAQQWAEHYRLPFHRQSWRGGQGSYQGNQAGTSLDFRDHRVYQPGDDPRHINWQAYARTGTYTMKVFEEEVRPEVDLIFDASPSMFEGEPAKRRRTLELLYFLGQLCAADEVLIHIHLCRGGEHRRLTLPDLLTHQWVAALESLPSGRSATPLSSHLIPISSQGMTILLSDLLFPGAPETHLRFARPHLGPGLILAPYSDEEAKPDWSGRYEFQDVEQENNAQRVTVDDATVRRYRAAYQNHLSQWKQSGLKLGYQFAHLSSAGSLIECLRPFVGRSELFSLA
ncbi:MAG: DUF58 domain-containing protein [Verrucomicrobiota bacterium]